MLGSRGKSSGKGQIALEFLVVYAFISIVFAVVFTLIASQRAATLTQQEYGLLQLQAQNIASYIDQAVQAGNGYSVTVPLAGAISSNPFNISISNTGVVLLQTKIIRQVISAYAFSYAKSMVVNGTLTGSGNGASVYLVPSYTGSITLSNSKGIIYVDQPAPSGVSLAQTISSTVKGNARAAMVTAGSNLYTPITTALQPSKFTISLWFLETGYGNGYPYAGTVYGSGGYNQGYELLLPQGSDTHGGIVVGNGAEAYVSDLGSPPLGTWNNYVATFDGTNVKLYLNGVLVNSGTQSGISYTGGISQFIVASNYNTAGNPAIYYSNVQLYNAALSGNQVNSIYQGGISLSPVMPANTIGWWPLNGNSNDYSGNGYAATGPTSYNSVVQESVHITSGNGDAIVSDPVGFTAGRGILSGAANSLGSVVYYTDSNGNATAFITANSFTSGATNLTVTAFSGNSTTAANLVGWWPLNEGSGNLTYDLSTHGDNGNFANAIWSAVNQNQTNFAGAQFPGRRSGLTGNNAIGFITVNQSSSLLNLARNGSFTATMWVNSSGASTAHNLGLMGDLPGATGRGFTIETTTSSTANAVWGVVINGTSLVTPTNSLTANRWLMITAEYNGSTGQASLYVNNTNVQSSLLQKNLDLGQATTPIYIGSMPYQGESTGFNNFNGLMTNVQLYSTYLTPSQIASLYRNGVNSAPLGDAGLTGWWPINGASNGIVPDFSSNNNSGTINYNVTFVNSQYTNRINTTFPVATFNGFSYVAGQASSFPTGSAARSVFAWVYLTGAPGSYYVAQSYGNQAASQGAYLYVNTAGNLAFDGYGNHLFSNMYPTRNTWHLIGSTYAAGATRMTLYLDGQNYTGNLESGALNTVIPAGTDPASIGDSANYGAGEGGFLGWKGSIANVQIYNSVLTQQQVRQLYQQGILLSKRQNVTLG
ncbi:MAG: laminin G domain-containing protein [Candidatus Micrarchaeota archaeon]|nr:laminin G domain-containing protein [Candidatus Micrarchaeota archaeon]